MAFNRSCRVRNVRVPMHLPSGRTREDPSAASSHPIASIASVPSTPTARARYALFSILTRRYRSSSGDSAMLHESRKRY